MGAVMSIECIAKARCFRDGRRFRPGETVIFEGNRKDLPAYLVPKSEYKSEEPAPIKQDTSQFEGAGVPVKADSSSEIPIGDKGSTPPVSYQAKILAEQFNVDVDDVTGTGTDGQVLKSDVKKYIDSNTGNNAEVI
jgi:pyruvate/2-oxoglutarate dehydrogenase complex dihydrolipoamide acyltransferase (E2) component